MKIKFRSTCITLFLLILKVWSPCQAQSTIAITGKISDFAKNESIIGATVIIDGTTKGTVTDYNGDFEINVAPGKYLVRVHYMGFESDSIEVTTNANGKTYIELQLKEAKAMALSEVLIVGVAKKSSDVIMNLNLKKAGVIASGITASEISKTPDRNIGDVLKRVTGTTIQENKFAVIRGMNDRYNAAYLDGSQLSSTESDRKAFAFDIIPSNLIDNLMVIKSGSADLSGDFGGGIIKINTKSIPDEFIQSINVGFQYHSLTTFNQFSKMKTYSSEEFNIINSKRDLPAFKEGDLKSGSAFPTSAEVARFGEISKTFNNDWSSNVFAASPGTRLSYLIGFPIQLKNDGRIGAMLALNYSKTLKISENSINSYDGSGQVSAFQDKKFGCNITTGGILNVNYVQGKTSINFHNLLNITTDNTWLSRGGYGNLSDQLSSQNSAFILNYNKLYNGLVGLNQTIGDSLFKIGASISYSKVNRQVPDYRIVSYTKLPEFPSYRLTLGDFFNSSSGRYASSLEEDIYGGTFELSREWNSNFIAAEFKLGAYYQDRNRDFWGRSFVYAGAPDETTLDPAKDLGESNIGPDKLYLVEKTSEDLSFYQAKSQLSAYYATANLKFGSHFRILSGLRMENMKLEVNNQFLLSTIAEINEMAALPSVTCTYSFNEKTNLRMSYFSSLNRPEFRELAAFSFFVFDKNAEIRGNRNLKIANLRNFDVRYEFYPDGGQIISVGAFYKNIQNPIELSLDITQPFTTFTFQNEKSANILGLELEFKKRLSFIKPGSFFENLAIYSNLSFIHSAVHFNAGSQAKSDRPLQGQSPYVLNARLQYENTDNGWSCNLSFNSLGRRIAYVGVDPSFGNTRQDIYETPRNVLDFQIGKSFRNLQLKLTIGDLFNSDLIFYQDVNQDGVFSQESISTGDRVMYQFNNGITSSLSLNYKF